jgi:hypothetical protein
MKKHQFGTRIPQQLSQPGLNIRELVFDKLAISTSFTTEWELHTAICTIGIVV